MAYKRISPQPVVEGGTGAQTLTGILTGNGAAAITGNAVTQFGVLVGGAANAASSLAVAATGTLLAGSTGANPAFTGSPSVSGSITAATSITSTLGNLNLTAPTNVDGTTGVIKIANVPFISALDQSNNPPTNIFVGVESGNTLMTLTGANNTGVGWATLNTLTSGNFNTMIGSGAGVAIETGGTNTAIGATTFASLTTGSENVAIGYGSLFNLRTTNNNTAVGYQALTLLATGINNTALGYNAGSALTTNDTNNIDIGNNGVAGDNGIIRIGTVGTHNSAIISGTIYASADSGAGIASTTALTNFSVPITMGVNSLVSTSVGGQTNAGYLKLYLGTTAIYVPYFTTT